MPAMTELSVLEFAGVLRQLRVEARLTQEELAEAAGLSPRSVSDLERGINRTARKDTADARTTDCWRRDAGGGIVGVPVRARAGYWFAPMAGRAGTVRQVRSAPSSRRRVAVRHRQPGRRPIMWEVLCAIEPSCAP
jgi:transcriptional regulator with XRE-family HTH domain